MTGAPTGPRAQLTACTTFALVAFAANSLFCRAALREEAIDPASFTTLRMVSGAAVLLAISAVSRRASRRPRPASPRGSWISAAMLALYALAFSFAYTSLSAGTGALILFGAVQVTMLGAGWRAGERLGFREWSGIALALAGLVYLVLPGLAAPPLVGSSLMAAAGVAWGVYSLRGRRALDPLAETGGNFARSVPLVLAVSLVALESTDLSFSGTLLAVASGALASGLGYVAWYAALRGLPASSAASVQLSVPVLAAVGGVVFLSEEVTLRLIVATVVILGGIRLSLAQRS